MSALPKVPDFAIDPVDAQDLLKWLQEIQAYGFDLSTISIDQSYSITDGDMQHSGVPLTLVVE